MLDDTGTFIKYVRRATFVNLSIRAAISLCKVDACNPVRVDSVRNSVAEHRTAKTSLTDTR